MTQHFIYASPIGYLNIHHDNQKLTRIEFIPKPNTAITKPTNAFSKQIHDSLTTYFKNPCSFDIELDLKGTPFQKKVWQALQAIPSGKPLTYKQLAEKLKTGARAVGNACRRNPVPIIVPCHRVVAQKGFGGYSGDTKGALLDVKKWLLKHEKSTLGF